jgi:hypothetical protein
MAVPRRHWSEQKLVISVSVMMSTFLFDFFSSFGIPLQNMEAENGVCDRLLKTVNWAIIEKIIWSDQVNQKTLHRFRQWQSSLNDEGTWTKQ